MPSPDRSSRSTEERKSKEDEEDDSLDDEAEKGKQPIDTTDEDIQRAPWKALFYFTTKPHLVPLSLGILASIVSGLASPAQAILIGRAFQQFSSYATGALTGTELLTKETEYVFYLLGLGCVGWIVEFFFFGFWLAFGELQAKSARDRLFTGLLERDIEWYDMRKNGIGALIPRLQACVTISTGVHTLSDVHTVKSASSSCRPLSRWEP